MKPISKKSVLAILVFALSACSGETDPEAEAKARFQAREAESQKQLQAEVKEIQAKAQARLEFEEKHCKDPKTDCNKLMQDAGLMSKDIL